MTTDTRPSVRGLILVPALITLGVTLLRLTGELMGWSALLASRAAGGAGAIIGIVWLVFVFGAWFGWRLTKAGEAPTSVGRVAGFALLAILVGAGVGALGAAVGGSPMVALFAFVVGSMASVLVAWRGWPALARVLLAYGFAARIPVALIMLAAIYGNWGTHYDVSPPGFDPNIGPLAKWFFIGLVPQLTIWIGFTVAVGSLFGALGAALARKRETAAATAASPATR
jgi:hypothetical protein